jgi:hypothetical protein
MSLLGGLNPATNNIENIYVSDGALHTEITNTDADPVPVDQKLPSEIKTVKGTTSATPGEITPVDLSALGTVVMIIVVCPPNVPGTITKNETMLQYNLDDVEENPEFDDLFPSGAKGFYINRTSVRLKSLNASAPYVIQVGVK